MYDDANRPNGLNDGPDRKQTAAEVELAALRAKMDDYRAKVKLVGIGAGMFVLGAVIGHLVTSNSASTRETDANVATAQAAQQALNRQAPEQQAPAVASVPAPEAFKQLTNDGFVTYIGNPKAKVTMHEFVDFQCPACQGADLQFLVPFKKQYVETGKVRLGLVHWPLDQIHHYANLSARSFVCAVGAGANPALSDTLFAHQQDWVVGGSSSADSAHVLEKLAQYAKKSGAASGEYDNCLKGAGRYDARFEQNGRLALALGATGTPTFYINGDKLQNGSPAAIAAKINSILYK